MEQVLRAAEAVAARLRRADLEGAAETLLWAARHGGMDGVFLAAERCVEATAGATQLPSSPPKALGRALHASNVSGLALAVGLKAPPGLGGKVPTGFGMVFGMSGRSVRLLVPAVLSRGLAFWCEKEWGEGCRVRAWGAVPAAEPPGYSPSIPLLGHPSSDDEEEAFGSLIDCCMAEGIPWVSTLNGMSQPKVSCEAACRMLFHAAGHAAKGNEEQCRLFLAGTFREAAAP